MSLDDTRATYDRKNYKLITLPGNGLKVLLVSSFSSFSQQQHSDPFLNQQVLNSSHLPGSTHGVSQMSQQQQQQQQQSLRDSSVHSIHATTSFHGTTASSNKLLQQQKRESSTSTTRDHFSCYNIHRSSSVILSTNSFFLPNGSQIVPASPQQNHIQPSQQDDIRKPSGLVNKKTSVHSLKFSASENAFRQSPLIVRKTSSKGDVSGGPLLLGPNIGSPDPWDLRKVSVGTASSAKSLKAGMKKKRVSGVFSTVEGHRISTLTRKLLDDDDDESETEELALNRKDTDDVDIETMRKGSSQAVSPIRKISGKKKKAPSLVSINNNNGTAASTSNAAPIANQQERSSSLKPIGSSLSLRSTSIFQTDGVSAAKQKKRHSSMVASTLDIPDLYGDDFDIPSIFDGKGTVGGREYSFVSASSSIHSHAAMGFQGRESFSSTTVAPTASLGSAQENTNTIQISPNLSMAAVSMAVGIGSFASPENLDGLAHFLEHMLFMGSEKYPVENKFDSVLSLAGGSSNAYTDAERTVFHFACPQEALQEVLDVFAQFFIAPLLLEEAADRELKSIESEFILRQNLDGCRLQEVWRESSDPETPFSKFSCGNLMTLREKPKASGINVYDALRKFHEENYVASNMCLCVVANEPLETMQKFITDMFAPIRAKQPTNTKIPPQIPLFPWRQLDDERRNPRGLGCIYRIAATQDMHELQMTWQLPPQSKNYKSKPTEYIAHLIGHESKGSILAEAKARGWATSLNAGVSGDDGFANNSMCTLFNVTISLTRSGLDEWMYVVGMVFEYIGMIASTGPQKWIFDELRDVALMQYRFLEEPDPHSLARRLSTVMLGGHSEEFYEKHLLNGSYLYFDWEPELIQTVLALLTPENVRIDLFSSRFSLAASGSRGDEEEIFGEMRGVSIDEAMRRHHTMETETDTVPNNMDDIATVVGRPRRSPIRERYTGVHYWVDVIPDSIVKLWRSVYDGKATVGFTPASPKNYSRSVAKSEEIIANRAEDGISNQDLNYEEQFPRSLHLPEPNPFISTDFSIRPYSGDIGSILYGARVAEIDSKKSGIVLLSTEYEDPVKKQTIQAVLVEFDDESGVRQWYSFSLTHIGKLKELTELTIPCEGSHMPIHVMLPTSKNARAASKIKEAPKALSFHGNHFHRPTASINDEDHFLLESERHDTITTLKDIYGPSNQAPSLMNLIANAKMSQSETAPIGLLPQSDDVFSFWFLQDRLFHIPRMEVFMYILTPVIHLSPLTSCLADLFSQIVFESLKKESYMGYISDLDFEIEVNPQGMQLRFAGFSHKLPILVKTVLQRLLNFNSEVEIQDSPSFYAQLESLSIDYNNASSQFRSGSQVSLVMHEAICKQLWSAESKSRMTGYITPALLSRFASYIFRKCRIEGFIHGNANFQDACDLFTNIRSLFKSLSAPGGLYSRDVTANGTSLLTFSDSKQLPDFPVSLPDEKVVRLKCIDLEPGPPNQSISGIVHVLEALESPAHSAELFFELGKEDDVKTRLVAQTLDQIIREPLYAELRSRKQLGYAVKSGVRSVYGTIGYVVEITSDSYGPEILADQVDAFFAEFRNTLLLMPQSTFAQHIYAIARRKLQHDNSLYEEAARHWRCILTKVANRRNTGYFWGENISEMIALHDTISQSLVLDCFDRWLNPSSPNRKRASIFVIGHDYDAANIIERVNKPYVTLVDTSQNTLDQVSSITSCLSIAQIHRETETQMMLATAPNILPSAIPNGVTTSLSHSHIHTTNPVSSTLLSAMKSTFSSTSSLMGASTTTSSTLATTNRDSKTIKDISGLAPEDKRARTKIRGCVCM